MQVKRPASTPARVVPEPRRNRRYCHVCLDLEQRPHEPRLRAVDNAFTQGSAQELAFDKCAFSEARLAG